MANNDLNADQDINNTAPNRPDEYATHSGSGSNPDLDVARDDERAGNDDRSQGGSAGNIDVTSYTTYNAPNDRTDASNASTGGGFGDASNADADANTPVMRRGGELTDTDVMAGDAAPGTPAGQVPQARTDTTVDEQYSTGPRTNDPEQELLNPGYDPRTENNTMGPNRTDNRVSPGLPGLPDQRGTLDQTTYSTESNTRRADAGSDRGTVLP